MILAELEIEAAMEEAEQKLPAAKATPSVFAEALAESTCSTDTVSEQLRSYGAQADEELRPRVGLSWLSMEEADAFIRLSGAKTAPYRLRLGGKQTSRSYCWTPCW